MKKLKLLLIPLILIIFTTGCFKKDNLEGIEIVTTAYPYEYVTNMLYGEHSLVTSIYPDGTDIYNYKISKKLKKDYSKKELFIYNGINNDKDLATDLLDYNNEMLIIDATYGLNYNEDIKELWLAPNNFLMLVKNIKSSLNEYLDNSFKEDDVNKKYDEIYEKVSWVDAELRNVARTAKENENNTIVVSDNLFKYLENYGFNVISLEDIENSGSENAINDIKSKFKNSTYKKILTLNSIENSSLVNELDTKYKGDVVTLNDIVTNSDTASDYVSIQYENISVIRDYLND